MSDKQKFEKLLKEYNDWYILDDGDRDWMIKEKYSDILVDIEEMYNNGKIKFESN